LLPVTVGDFLNIAFPVTISDSLETTVSKILNKFSLGIKSSKQYINGHWAALTRRGLAVTAINRVARHSKTVIFIFVSIREIHILMFIKSLFGGGKMDWRLLIDYSKHRCAQLFIWEA
jgi:hypothetical protein